MLRQTLSSPTKYSWVSFQKFGTNLSSSKLMALARQQISNTIALNPTKLPTENPEEFHKRAIEKSMSTKVAKGYKTVDLQKIRPVIPDFAKEPPQTWVKNINNQVLEMMPLSRYLFACPPRKDILHQVVVWQLAKRRQGTHKTKYRLEVAFTKKKMYQQKGTGRARHQDRGAPIFTRGGHTHPKRPRKYGFKLNKKFRKLGLRMALTTKYLQGKLFVVDECKMETGKTREVSAKFDEFLRLNMSNLEGLPLETSADFKKLPDNKKKVIYLDQFIDPKLQQGSWNIHYLQVQNVKGVNVYDLLNHNYVVMSKAAVQYLTDKYSEKEKLEGFLR